MIIRTAKLPPDVAAATVALWSETAGGRVVMLATTRPGRGGVIGPTEHILGRAITVAQAEALRDAYPHATLTAPVTAAAVTLRAAAGDTTLPIWRIEQPLSAPPPPPRPTAPPDDLTAAQLWTYLATLGIDQDDVIAVIAASDMTTVEKATLKALVRTAQEYRRDDPRLLLLAQAVQVDDAPLAADQAALDAHFRAAAS